MEKVFIVFDWIVLVVLKNEFDVNLFVVFFCVDEMMVYLLVIIEIEGNSFFRGYEELQLLVEFFIYVMDDKGEMQDFFM